MADLYETKKDHRETVVLVGVLLRGTEEWKIKSTMDELAQLAESAGAVVVKRFVSRQQKIKAGHYVGTGKAEEIADWIKENSASLVVFDDDLTPAQGRNLEAALETRVLDRTQLILDIFAQRAHTKEGCLQVELAQHLYLMPRLRNMWTHLERQQGGIGLRGPGETQVEMDKRRIEELIKTIRRDLKLVRVRRTEQRRGRRRHGWALVSIVGYTNAGKSTLLNRLSGAEIFAEDQLFATLDPTTRQVELPNHEPTLMTDTVGFIQKLPHHLVESFKATLEEVAEADLILHVVDASHPQVDTQIEAVHTVLGEISAMDKPMLYIFNKVDTEAGRETAKRLTEQYSNSVAVSALTGDGIDQLYDQLAECLKGRKITLELSLPLNEGKILSALQKSGSIIEEEYEGAIAELLVRVSPQMAAQCQPFLKADSEVNPVKNTDPWATKPDS